MPETHTPESEDQVRDLVALAAAEKRRLAIEGSGTKTDFGFRVEHDWLVSLNRCRGIIEYQPAELVMKAGAGTPLTEIEAELSRNGQCLAFEPPRLGGLYNGKHNGGTIGGIFMGNLSGPRRFSAGAARDHILGVRAVSGRGELYKSGGSVIKNVTGYDLCRLLTGSWGTLSIVTELSFKVLPAAPATATLAVTGVSDQEAFALIGEVARSNCEASGLAFLPSQTVPEFRGDLSLHGNLVLFRFEGGRDSIRERVNAVAAFLPAGAASVLLDEAASLPVWESIRDAEVFADPVRTPGLMKLSLPPASALDISRVIDRLRGCEWYADVAGGWIWLGICQASCEDKINTIRREIATCSGSAVLYRAPESIKQQVGVFSPRPPALAALHGRIKHSFDPDNLLNPGRLGED